MRTVGRRSFAHSMIVSPGRRLLRHAALVFVRKRALGAGRRASNASLSLTSFIDFLIVVVVFLLMSFSATAQQPVDASTRVPLARNTLDMIAAPLVSVTGTVVTVDGVPAGSTRPIEDTGRLMRVEELRSVLARKKELWTTLTPSARFPGVVVLQIDQRASALVVKSIVRTVSEAGYGDVSFMVGELPRE